MADVRVKITTEADTSPIAKYKAEMDVLQANLGKTGQATEKLDLKKRDLKKILKELGHEIPGLGKAVLFLFHPLAVVAGAVGALILALKNWLAEIDKAEQKIEVHAAIGRTAAAMGAASGQAARELLEFNIQLGALAEKGEAASKRLDAVVGAMKKIESQQAEQRDAQEALELAKIDAAEKTGKLSEVQAISQRAAVKSRFRGQREAAALAGLQEEQDARKEALSREMAQRLTAEETLPAALTAAAQADRVAKTAPEKAKSDLAAIAEERATLEKELKTQRALQQGSTGNFWKDLVAPMLGRQAGEELARAQKAAPGRIEELERRRDALDRQEFVVGERQKAAEDEAKAKRKAADDLQKSIQTGRASEGKLFEDILRGDQGIEQSRWHRNQVGRLAGEAERISTETATAIAEARAQKQRADALEALLNSMFRGMKVQAADHEALRQQVEALHQR